MIEYTIESFGMESDRVNISTSSRSEYVHHPYPVVTLRGHGKITTLDVENMQRGRYHLIPVPDPDTTVADTLRHDMLEIPY